MLNGIDLHLWNLLVEQFDAHPWRAQVALAVESTTDVSCGMADYLTMPMRVGEKRIVRPFRLTVRDLTAEHAASEVENDIYSREDLFSIALGSCYVISLAKLLSERDVQILKLSNRVAASAGEIVMSVDIETDSYIESGAEALREAYRRSSMVQTLVNPCPIRAMVIGAAGESVRVEGVNPGGADFPSISSTDVQWAGGTRARLTSAVHDCTDEAKQLLGIDSAPDPRELMLTALANEYLTAVKAVPASMARVHASARCDLRALRPQDSQPANLQNVLIQIMVEDDAAMTAALMVSSGPVSRAFEQQNAIVVNARINGEIFEMNSLLGPVVST